MRLRLALLLLLAPAAHAQGIVMLAGGGSEGSIGDTDAWSYRLYKSLVENGDVDGDGTVRVAVIARQFETEFIPDYFEWIGTTLGVTVDAFNVQVGSTVSANNPAVVGPVATADAAFLKGGDQGQYYDLWNDTLLETHLRGIAARGGALGGTSAGAMSLAEHCLCGGKSLVSPHVLADAHTVYLDDLSEPGTSGIHSDFLGTLPGMFVDTHFTERGRLGRLLGVLAKATGDTGDDAILAIGVEAQTGVVIRQDTATVIGEASVDFVQETGETDRRRDAGVPLTYTHLRLDRLVDGWQYRLSARRPVLGPLPPGAEPVVYPGDGLPNEGGLTILGSEPADKEKFEWVATHYPEPYSLTATPAPAFVRDAVGFTEVFDDEYLGDRQEVLFRAFYDRPNLSAFFVFGPYPGAGTEGGRVERETGAPDEAAFEGDVASIVVDGKPITHRGIAPEVNDYRVRSAALVDARLHVLHDGWAYHTRSHVLIPTSVGTEAGPPGRESILRVLPNPVRDRAEVQLRLLGSERVRVEVLDGLGRRVALVFDGPAGPGERRLALDTRPLPSGLYTVRVTGESGLTLTQRLAVVR